MEKVIHHWIQRLCPQILSATCPKFRGAIMHQIAAVFPGPGSWSYQEEISQDDTARRPHCPPRSHLSFWWRSPILVVKWTCSISLGVLVTRQIWEWFSASLCLTCLTAMWNERKDSFLSAELSWERKIAGSNSASSLTGHHVGSSSKNDGFPLQESCVKGKKWWVSLNFFHVCSEKWESWSPKNGCRETQSPCGHLIPQVAHRYHHKPQSAKIFGCGTQGWYKPNDVSMMWFLGSPLIGQRKCSKNMHAGISSNAPGR